MINLAAGDKNQIPPGLNTSVYAASGDNGDNFARSWERWMIYVNGLTGVADYS